jgi:hypothetical protein
MSVLLPQVILFALIVLTRLKAASVVVLRPIRGVAHRAGTELSPGLWHQDVRHGIFNADSLGLIAGGINIDSDTPTREETLLIIIKLWVISIEEDPINVGKCIRGHHAPGDGEDWADW